MRFSLKLIFILATLCSVSQITAQTYTGKEKDIQQILKNIESFSKFYMAGDVESLVNCYTNDGKIFPNNLKILEGKSDLEKYWTLPEGVKVLHHKVTPTEIKIIKKEAYDYGYYEGATQNEKGEKSTWQGKYVIVWKKVGKDWKIYLDIWNSVPK